MNLQRVASLLTFADKLLIAGLLALSLGSYPLVRHLTRQDGQQVHIELDGSSYRILSLHIDQTVSVPGPLGKTVVVIQRGSVFVSESPCRNKICVHTGHIAAAGQVIVCLPNKVTVRITGGGNAACDAITR